ncbi:hypothetical protein KSS87_018062 [Heliosperma pusillum]|nr:hypothetical protein KSS87_018062 [Heliosperma pusillum]
MEVLNGVVSIGKLSVFASKTQLAYSNKGHLDYYGESKGKGKGKGKKEWNSVSTKKKIKLLKNLTKDLSTFSDLGFGFNSNLHQFNHHQNNNSITISQAAEVLLVQLQQLRTEEEKQEKKEKEEKKGCKNSNCNSSSSESESSDSECDKVANIKRVGNVSIVQPNETYLPATNEKIFGNLEQECSSSCSNMILETTLNKDASIQVLNLKQSDMGKRINVCMGGKCKKSGAPALLEELQKVVGDEGSVIGCKCMGKCKTAPNVKVSTGETLGDDSLRYPSNPLYIGVGLEDVELIVASYFGEELKGLGMSVSSAAS